MLNLPAPMASVSQADGMTLQQALDALGLHKSDSRFRLDKAFKQKFEKVERDQHLDKTDKEALIDVFWEARSILLNIQKLRRLRKIQQPNQQAPSHSPTWDDPINKAEIAFDSAKTEGDGVSDHLTNNMGGTPIGEDDQDDVIDVIDMSGEAFGPDHPVTRVTWYIDQAGIEVLADQSLRYGWAPPMAAHPNAILGYLAIQDINWVSLLDDISAYFAKQEPKLAKAELAPALRYVLRKKSHSRRADILFPLVHPRLKAQAKKVAVEWRRLASVFDDEPDVVIAVFQHFIWQVKRKQLGLSVVDHVMPIIFSEVQGSGKSTFVENFLSPLQELVGGPALIEDVVDPRSVHLFSFPVIWGDDIGAVRAGVIPDLKGIMSNKLLRRRVLHTSMTQGIEQRSTLIGTSNMPVHELFDDPSGYRRFMQLAFKNGAAAKGGDPAVWQTVSSLDFDLLWLSVNAFAPCPIKPFLKILADRERSARPDPLRQWLIQLNLESEEVDQIRVRAGLKAQGLYDLFCMQTASTTSLAEFGSKMKSYAFDPSVPFGPKVKTDKGFVYPLKKRKEQSPQSTEAAS